MHQHERDPKQLLQPWQAELATVTLRGWQSPRCGHNGKPVIHFLHGTGLSNLTYWPFLQHFLPEFDLFLNTLEGHGDSDYQQRPESGQWDQLRADSQAAFEQQRADWPISTPVIALGHSFGAVASILMHNQLARPFDQYILLDPVIYPKSMIALLRLLTLLGLNQRLPHVRQAERRRSQWHSRAAVAESFRGRGVFRNWHESALQSYIDHAVMETPAGQWQLRCPTWLEARIFAGCPQGLWSAIGQLPAHTHILHSVQTYAFVPPAVRKAEQANPHIQLTQVDGGHCFMQEQPLLSYRQVHRLIKVGKGHVDHCGNE